MSDPVFEVENVSRVFTGSGRRVTAVDDVSLTLARGERLGIVGESGSGKSTLIRMMAALDRPTSGSIRLNGTDIALPESRLGFLRSAVQLVFQDPRSSLNPRMRVSDIISEPLRSPLLRGREDVPTDRPARVREVLDAVGLPADSGRRYPHEFSGGQRQRIAIARALAPNPQVLIADEAVSALDVSVRAQVLNLLNDLVTGFGLTLVFVSHDLMVVRHICDSVLVLRSGRVVERGPTMQVYADPQAEYTRELLAAVPRLPE
ncbi:peptide/nickel transport system ATP-binding protein [Propionibacteriaceae bacterium ES.041]|uniref:ABC transporter ATP-binding protein n=1 Tax=Enemella evansiae TaxID=2016499 RepID=UPI000B978D6F|nr:ATP-binding cassette domain-containing protein [Enemella evansiae]OYN98919.1 peptide ABC transporter ATP-binding protein [Enemella evansiae]PFG67573.1 peptide/nickel transport system ATP-binding protein [Propionibacteriaceae bacterium ES.041]